MSTKRHFSGAKCAGDGLTVTAAAYVAGDQCVKGVLDVLWTSEWACGFQIECVVEMFSVVSFTFHPGMEKNI